MIRYWSGFVLHDSFTYVQLYLAIRSGDWSLRVSAIKQMAPLFFAFDQVVYMELIPHHLAAHGEYPKEILACFEKGGFAVQLTGELWSNVALDGAHKMLVNKDLKSAVIRPTTEYLQKNFNLFQLQNCIIQKLHRTNTAY